MKKLLSVLILLTLFLSAQSYESSWEEVHNFEKKSLPKSSLKKVEEIYQQAKKEQNEIQFMKALFYKEKYLFRLNEEGYIGVIKDLKKAINETTSKSNKLILTSILAETYQKYLNQNRYKNYNRTAIKDNKSQDIATWSLEKLSKKATQLYLDSLDKSAQKVDIDRYSQILNMGEHTEALRPTLYDFLAFRTLNYLKRAYNLSSQPLDSFTVKDPDAFGSAYTFMYLTLPTEDRDAYNYQSMLIYQKLIEFHQAYHHERALDYVNIERLKFVKENFSAINKEELFVEALKKIVTNNLESEAILELANYYRNKGNYIKAIEYAKEGIKSQNSYISSTAQSIINRIESKKLKFEVEKINLPKENILSKITYKNGHELFVKIIKLTKDEREKFDEKNYDERASYIKSLSTFKKFKITLPKKNDYKKHSTEVSLESYEIGEYLFVLSFGKEIDNHAIYKIVHISNIAYMKQGSKKIIVLHRKTGKPLSDVKTSFYQESYDQTTRKNKREFYTTVRSNKKGEVSIPQLKNSYIITFEYKEDRLNLGEGDYYGEYNQNGRNYKNSMVEFFTDRSIYRPNQTIYFKGLALTYFKDKEPKVLDNKEINVSFFNTNYQLIESKKFTTNEFGTFNGSFTAPQSGLLGSMQIQANLGGITRVQVEEYKRPKFDLSFKPLEKSYKLEDNIKLVGEAKAYAGNGVEGAKVNYRVVRSASFPWVPWWQQKRVYKSYEQEIATGSITSDKNGQFKINFQALIDKKVDAKDRPNYNYKISVDVTDTTGETHSAIKNITLGYIGINIDMNIASQLEQDGNQNLTINSTNLDGVFQPIQGEILIEKLSLEPKIYRRRYWQEVDMQLYSKEEFNKLFTHYRYGRMGENQTKKYIKTLKFNTQQSKTISLGNLKQGKYLLTLKSFDQDGVEVSKEKHITIYSLKAKRPPSPSYLWQKLDKKLYTSLPSSAKLYLKSSIDSLPVLLTIERRGKVDTEQWIELHQAKEEIIKISKKDRGDIHYQLSFIQNNRPYNQRGTIVVPWDNNLKIELISFRDKLKPNQEEEWKLKISGKDKERVVAEMVATIYDASLDQFRGHNFSFPYLFPKFKYSYIHQWKAQYFQPISAQKSWQQNTKESLYRTFQTLKWLNSNQRNYGSNRVYSDAYGAVTPMMEIGYGASTIPMPSPTPPRATPTECKGSNCSINIGYPSDARRTTHDSKTEESTPAPITIRKNFNETLLFKPHLQTDKEGNIIINFKTNEALTRWNFIAFAHTKDLKTASIKRSFTTSKELMVVSNLPRFFRERDTITLSAKVVNTSNQNLQGECELKLVDPVTQKPIFTKVFKKPFSIEKGSSTVIDFTIKVPDIDKVSAIQHTLIARTTSHTDAEQVIKPILSNRVFLTESKVLSVKANQEKSFTLESLKNSHSNTLKHHKLTLEFTSNPAWYAIQSLPYLMEYEHECSEQLFSRYYANALAQNIANKTPKIKAIFDSWRANGKLKSQLSSNQELKSVLLEETPWVLESQTEEEQQKNIALLFDLHRVASEQKEALDKLAERQLSSGGWSWFGGKRANWYITQYIVEGMGHLKVLGIDKDANGMLPKAIKYIDQQIIQEYNTLIASIEDGHRKLEDDNLNSMIIHYIYARSFFTQQMESKAQTAHHYYLEQAKKYWTTKGIYEKGMIALALHRLGESSKDIVASIKEHAIESDEFGTYFKYSNGYHWNELPVETHALMIEVFETIAHDKKMVEELKIWLLKQRQTTHWKTTKATSSAIYALLSNSHWLNSDRLVQIEFETTKNYQPKLQKAQSNATKGLGYYKVSYNKDEFDASMATVKVTNPNSTIAWGGLYWQYFEEMNRVKTFKETPLTINKKLFLLEQSRKGEHLIPIQNVALKVGDKIKVRIEIKVDRDMEYVMLKDSRASTFEPLNVISQYKWQDGLGYYQSTKDNATYFFIDYLPKGTYIFEYPLVTTHKGSFSNGITTMESMYAPEFKSHSEGVQVTVK